ncbi:RodZ domain-containing protein [Colwellia sp. E2M01]|uniref:RodZ domain-containing protein n=1 Tax=Colwellia sp. E2M01 TaxID=2841561 RepID=UPI001C09DECE|nr:RodZ domain-containing protein [Colwellia sp. E2M01]MBU2869782.1 DUF4115 domain-containing protein [Colwellia sp. E2M01]
MNKEVDVILNKSDKSRQQNADDKLHTELSEDMEMVSPGAMLCEGRKAQSLTQEHIAIKLNFSVSLVKSLEENRFDPAVPVTFIRGYLTNYAKLVNVDVEDVLASYETLNVANIQRTEMLSFSKQTSKQAEHSRVMWLSYLIVAVLVGLTIMWWLQDNKQQNQDKAQSAPVITEAAAAKDTDSTTVIENDNTADNAELNVINKTELNKNAKSGLDEKNLNENNLNELSIDENNIGEVTVSDVAANISTDDVNQTEEPGLSKAIFTFSGDCWVNIFDATGERIAWGVKKTGYVMTIEGVAPLRITVGKPELTSIVFNGQAVDMSAFNVGNIAKFNLPLDE